MVSGRLSVTQGAQSPQRNTLEAVGSEHRLANAPSVVSVASRLPVALPVVSSGVAGSHDGGRLLQPLEADEAVSVAQWRAAGHLGQAGQPADHGRTRQLSASSVETIDKITVAEIERTYKADDGCQVRTSCELEM